MDLTKLTKKQKDFAKAYVAHADARLIAAADTVGIDYEDALKYARSPAIKAYIGEEMKELREGVQHNIDRAAVEAIQALVTLVSNPLVKDSDRIQAAKDILTRAGYNPAPTQAQEGVRVTSPFVGLSVEDLRKLANGEE